MRLWTASPLLFTLLTLYPTFSLYFFSFFISNLSFSLYLFCPSRLLYLLSLHYLFISSLSLFPLSILCSFILSLFLLSLFISFISYFFIFLFIFRVYFSTGPIKIIDFERFFGFFDFENDLNVWRIDETDLSLFLLTLFSTHSLSLFYLLLLYFSVHFLCIFFHWAYKNPRFWSFFIFSIFERISKFEG